MNPFYRPQVTDELLSAYIDGAVTHEEKLQIEKAVQNDANVAWRLESLRQTVQLLRSLPEVPLPRSFVLTEADVAPQSKAVPPFVTTARRISLPPQPVPQRSGFWESLRNFLQGGSPLLRNLATTGLAVWLVLFATTQINPTKISVERIQVPGTQSRVADSTAAEPTPLSTVAESAAGVPNTTIENPTLAAPTNAEAQHTVEVVTPLTAAPVTQEQPSESLKAMGGGQAAGEQAATTPGEDMSSPLDAAMSAVGAPSGTSAADAQASVASSTTDTEVAAASIAAAAMPPAEEQPQSNAVVSSEVGNSETTSASESPLGEAAQMSAVQPTSEQANVAAAPAAQVVEPTPTQVVEPTPTSEPTVVLALPEVDAQPKTQVEQYAATEQPTAVAVADASTFNNSATQADQQRTSQPVEEVTSTPYFDPVRMQLAQLVVALVTAVLALFWLGSHIGKRG